MTAASELRAAIVPEPLVLSRIFHAPREVVFTAWSSADHLKRWFAPAHFIVPEAVVDFRPGGAIDLCMRAPDGQDHWSRGHYLEIDPPDRLVFAGDVVVGGERKFAVRTTVTFEVAGTGTNLTVRQEYEIFDEAFMAAVSGAPEGWRTTLDKLDREIERIKLETAQATRGAVHGSFTIRRRYAAAPALVFRALTDPAAKARWFSGPDGFETLERAIDARPGGRERLRTRWTSGLVSTFDAVYFDVVPDARLVYTYEMRLADRKISVSLATIELAPDGAGTNLTVTEQGVFLDGYDDAGSREHGVGGLLDRMGATLEP